MSERTTKVITVQFAIVSDKSPEVLERFTKNLINNLAYIEVGHDGKLTVIDSDVILMYNVDVLEYDPRVDPM